MKSVLNVEVSCFKSYASKEPKSVNLLDWLSSDKYAKEVLALRAIKDKAKRDGIKAGLPAITVSGIFDPVRKEKNLVKHSSLICIDIDRKGNEHIDNFGELKQELFKIKNVAYSGLSASGKGFFLIIPITYPKLHKQQFKALKNAFSEFGVTIDSAPQNVASLRGYSYDSDALFRHNAIPYRKWADPERKKSEKPVAKFRPNRNITDVREKVEALIQQIVQNRIDITNNEPVWFRIACALANEFGESGREYFHEVSQFYAKYDRQEADQKYNHALQGKYKQIGVGTFFKMLQSHKGERKNRYFCAKRAPLIEE